MTEWTDIFFLKRYVNWIRTKTDFHAEVIIETIRQIRNIQGIKVSQTEIKISVFADDTTLYIGENTSPIHLQNQVQDFKLFAGVKYNREKCVGM